MIKRIVGIIGICSCLFFFQMVDAQTPELPEPTIEQPQGALSLEELSDAFLVAEKKFESIKKELKYTETLKGNKKYKKEVASKYEVANNNLKLAKAAYEAALNPVETEELKEVEASEDVSTDVFPLN